MDTDPLSVARALGRLSKAASEAGAVLRSAVKNDAAGDAGAFAFAADLAALATAQKRVAAWPETAAALDSWVRAAQGRARERQERTKARLAGSLSEVLKARGLRLEGRLPELRAGVLTLELVLDKNEARIWYGPRIAKIATAPLESKALAEAVEGALDELSEEGPSDERALAALHEAWRVGLARAGKPVEAGEPAAILAIAAELGWIRQHERVRSGSSAAFTPYPAHRFSYDLYRLGVRRLGDLELQLGVATRDQTRKAGATLWIPRGSRGEGTHFSTLTFRAART